LNDIRLQQLSDWASETIEQLLDKRCAGLKLTPVSGDASFRRYFRAEVGADSFIAVDAPPEHEDSDRFLRVSNLLLDAGLAVPKVYAIDSGRGFMLLADLGDALYLPELESQQRGGGEQTVDRLYQQAIDSLLVLQQRVEPERLPPYDQSALRDEGALFAPWFCEGLLRYALNKDELALIDRVLDLLEQAALAQPVVAVHRDFHSRNLMLLDKEKFPRASGPGIIDFQDAVAGPYSYDLVSLLRDCYIFWPDPEVRAWCDYYLRGAHERGMLKQVDSKRLRHDLDLMGLQRHLKVLGVFARLAIRDKKTGYLADIPLVIRYILEVTRDYPDLAPLAEFRQWFVEHLLPKTESLLNVNLERWS
jgi:aminoglycoside/choline kinase family phosphotransferase